LLSYYSNVSNLVIHGKYFYFPGNLKRQLQCPGLETEYRVFNCLCVTYNSHSICVMICTVGFLLFFCRTKHIEVESHFIPRKLQEGLIHFLLIPSSAQVVDMLTELIHSCFFRENLSKSNLYHIHALAFGALLDNKDENPTDPI